MWVLATTDCRHRSGRNGGSTARTTGRTIPGCEMSWLGSLSGNGSRSPGCETENGSMLRDSGGVSATGRPGCETASIGSRGPESVTAKPGCGSAWRGCGSAWRGSAWRSPGCGFGGCGCGHRRPIGSVDCETPRCAIAGLGSATLHCATAESDCETPRSGSAGHGCGRPRCASVANDCAFGAASRGCGAAVRGCGAALPGFASGPRGSGRTCGIGRRSCAGRLRAPTTGVRHGR